MPYKLVFLTAFLSFLLLFVCPLPAQEEEQLSVPKVWIDESKDDEDMINYARRCVAEKKFKPAIEVYQVLIEKSRTDKEYKSRVVHRSESVYLPLSRCCYSEILSLPEEGKQVYSILYAAKADRALAEALERREMAKLESVASDYLLTEAGKKALLAIADISMENSDFSCALRSLDNLAEYHYQAVGEPPLLVLKRAACYLQLGELEVARRLVEGILSEPSKSLLSSQETALAQRILDELKLKGKPASHKSVNLFYDSYLSLEKEPDISVLARRKPTQPDTLEWQFLMDRPRQAYEWDFSDSTWQPSCNPFPLIAGDLVFLNDSVRVFALCADGGKIRWREPSREASKMPGVPLGLAESEGVIYAVLRNTNTLTEVNIRGAVEGPVSALTDLYAFRADAAGSNPPLWSTSDMRESTLLGNVSFASIPLVEGKRVYLGGFEITGQDVNYSVVCITTDGKPLWKTRVCATKYAGGRRSLPSPNFSSLAAYHGSVIFCSNVGVVASISLTGELEWLYKYPSGLPSAETSLPPFQRVPLSGGWQPNPPIVWCGTLGPKVYEILILAPQDSDFLFAFSLRDKRLLWRCPRNGHSQIIGPRRDMVFIYGGAAELETGKLAARALRIPNGKVIWEVAFDDTPAGKGIVTDKAIYIPCVKGLLKIEEVEAVPPDIPAKVTQSIEWYSFEEEKLTEAKKRPETPEEQRLVGRVRVLRRGVPTPPEELTQGNNARGSLLFFGDRIITCGFSLTNSFRQQHKK